MTIHRGKNFLYVWHCFYLCVQNLWKPYTVCGKRYCAPNSIFYIVDNSPPDYDSSEIESLIADYFSSEQYRYQRSQTNLGFGAGHNLALDTDSEFHLILNPDLILDEDALTNAMAFMQANPECGLLTIGIYTS